MALQSAEQFLSGLPIEKYFQFGSQPAPGLPESVRFHQGRLGRAAPPSPVAVRRSKRTCAVSTDPPSRRAALMIPPRYRLLSRWDSKTCPCLDMRDERKDLLESSIPYRCNLLLPVERQPKQREEERTAHPVAFIRFINKKLKEAEGRIREQHNLLMAIRKVTKEDCAGLVPAEHSCVGLQQLNVMFVSCLSV